MPEYFKNHRIDQNNSQWNIVSKYKHIYAWILKDVETFKTLQKYVHNKGAITLVKLPKKHPYYNSE